MPDRVVDPGPWLDEVGEVFVTIRGHDSGCTSYGVTVAGSRWFVKVAYGGARWQLDATLAVHTRVRHPAIVPLVASFDVVGGGRAVVHPWVDGENLNDPHVPGAPPREATGSALDRFRSLPDDTALAAYDSLLDAHVAVAGAGLVAVDLYDGSLVYDFDARVLHVVDLDLYAPAYVLELDRQLGSRRLMSPEELTRGARVDERSMVYTLARLAEHLGCARTGDLRAVVADATQERPDDRQPTVVALALAWRAAR